MEKSFEEFFCYILYSKSINRYYIGYTSDLEERLKQYIVNLKKNPNLIEKILKDFSK